MSDKTAAKLGWSLAWCKDALLLARSKAWILASYCSGRNYDNPNAMRSWLNNVRNVQDVLDEFHGDYII